MRRAMTLIELIFSMVIIALAFTVLPKILQVAAKSSKTTLKEEAMYNAVALMGLVRSLAWDDKNAKQTDEILYASGGSQAYTCGVLKKMYREGGFIGSRNCEHNISASAIGAESTDERDNPDDIDDLNDKNITLTNFNGYREYNASITVDYVQDYDTQFSSSPVSGTSNVKMVVIRVEVPKAKQAVLGSSFAQLSYFASNIGQLTIYRVPWKKP